VGWRALVRSLKEEAPLWARTLPQLPRLVHRNLARDAGATRIEAALGRLERAQRLQARTLMALAFLVAVFVVAYLLGA